jgi:osmotically inducible protein OsmC
MAATRQAKVIWMGDLAKGGGEVTAASSGRFDSLPVSWAARTEAPDGKTSPEELLAAAHASCFAMALSAELGRAGMPPERLEVTATVRFDKVLDAWAVVSSELEVIASVPGVDDEKFTQLVQEAKDGCPISRALKGNVVVSVASKLERSESRV